MQDDLNVKSKYFRLNKLTLNVGKTMYILFKSPRMKLLTSKSLVIDGNHVDYVLSNILHAVGVLKRLRYRGIPVSTRKVIYYSLIHSHLQYHSLVWGSASKTVLKPLQIAQN
ncbi:hypothetical protein PR048_003820, partial [Dryococelus australis]